ncbi:hypothetical protein, partial [Pseudomonas savastanoi]
ETGATEGAAVAACTALTDGETATAKQTAEAKRFFLIDIHHIERLASVNLSDQQFADSNWFNAIRRLCIFRRPPLNVESEERPFSGNPVAAIAKSGL